MADGGGSDEPNEMNQETEPSDNIKPASEGKYDLHLMNNSYSTNTESDNEYNVLLVTDL